jgi:hypothetical protein
MSLSPPVAKHLAVLDQLSQQRMLRRDDLAVLLEAAYCNGREGDLEQISFLGKFCVRAYRIMKRIGNEGEGYDRLSAEFSANLGKARTMLEKLIHCVPEPSRDALAGRYLAVTPAALEDLLELLQDVSWHKNWRIDHPGESPWLISPA